MRLHEDINAFRVLIDDIQKRTGYRSDVLEKDYYVVLILEELAGLQAEGLPAYFKGGTALYKALHTTNRFSEVISVYSYVPITVYDKDDVLQRFGKLKIEATSFTISEPVEKLEISAMIYELATEEQKKILETRYDVKPFFVLTITLERIFVDKLFAAEAYVRKSETEGRAFEAAKHIYDLSVMGGLAQIRKLMEDEGQMERLLSIRMMEELKRLDGIPGVAPIDFTFFDSVVTNKEVRNAYEIMQRQYVFRECDQIPYDGAVKALADIRDCLNDNYKWRIAKCSGNYN